MELQSQIQLLLNDLRLMTLLRFGQRPCFAFGVSSLLIVIVVDKTMSGLKALSWQADKAHMPPQMLCHPSIMVHKS